MKHSPYDYLMRRRLSESTGDLIETDRRIIDIALDYRFNNPETYSRAFKRIFGTQPNQLRKRGRIDRRRVMPRLTPRHIKYIGEGGFLNPVLEQRDAFEVAGLVTLVKDDPTVVAELWEMLARELSAIGIQPETHCGIAWYPEEWEDRGFFYLAGIEIDASDVTHSALVVKTIPVARYARFVHRGSWEERWLTLDHAYHTWLPKSEYSLGVPLEIECYQRSFRNLDEEPGWAILIPTEQTCPEIEHYAPK